MVSEELIVSRLGRTTLHYTLLITALLLLHFLGTRTFHSPTANLIYKVLPISHAYRPLFEHFLDMWPVFATYVKVMSLGFGEYE